MTDALSPILSQKRHVDSYLLAFLARKKKALAQVNPWGRDVIDRLSPFVVSGKTTRGSLAVFVYSMFRKTLTSKIYAAAGALELYHSGFLIHDDVMDKDTMRRGRLSMWEQYRNASSSAHVGISQAINAGDLCFMMAQELLSSIRFLDRVACEMQSVIVAQMQDVMSGRGTSLSYEDVVSLYRYKTARYTFSLSMEVGATVAGVNEDRISGFVRLGESMGLLYQIRDDELSVSGDSSVTGKPVGSDGRNAKQTLATLLRGEELLDFKSSLLEHCDNEIDHLPIEVVHKTVLAALVKFCIMRDK